jgi:hypothetical protein
LLYVALHNIIIPWNLPVVVVVDEVSEQCIVIDYDVRYSFASNLPVTVVVEVVSDDRIVIDYTAQHN